MRSVAVLLVALAGVAFAADENEASFAAMTTYSMGGGCPSSCSGHGYCRADAKCFCFEGWLGFDCSKRECPSYPAWGVNGAILHKSVECSYRGVCDRASGSCKCFDGYEGSACERTTCPNDCSGHGKCRFISELSNNVATTWDVNRVQTCVCDGGYTGSDCSLRSCPYGNDPQTICTGQDYQVQQITITWPAAAGANSDGDLVLAFTDALGNTWNTEPITNVWRDPTNPTTVAGASAISSRVAAALKNLPNFVVDDVSVLTGPTSYTATADTAATPDTDTTLSILVTFSGANTPGNQNLLTCPSNNGCNTPGCSPKYNPLISVAATKPDSKVDLVTPVNLLTATGADGFASTGSLQITVTVQDGAFNVALVYNGGASTNLYSAPVAVPVEAQHGKYVDIGYGIQLKFACTTPGLSSTCPHTIGSTPAVYVWNIDTPSCSTAVVRQAGLDNENIECSGRGVCARDSGMCQCFAGYTGYACNTQNIIL
jgi:hypothetical protein